MSLRQWNTSFEHKQLAKITTSLALYQANIGTSEMEEDVRSGSSSSSATSSLVSSSSSSSASDMDLDQTTLIDPVLLKLIVTMTNLNKKINGIVSDDYIVWGCTPTIMDLSESDAIANCRLCKVDLRTLDTIYIKTQVFRLLRYYSPAPRNIARSDWATQNITHNMTSSKT